MKKVITTTAFSLMTVFAMAQPEKGAIVLFGGGGFNANTSTSETPSLTDPTMTVTSETKSNNLNLDFGGAYFLTNNISVILAAIIASSSSETGGTQTISNFNGGARLGARYYHPCGAPRFYTYGEAGLWYTGGSQTSFNPNTGIQNGKDQLSNIGFGINPGFAYFLTPAIALEMSFGLIGWNQSVRRDDANSDNRITDSQFQFLLDSKAFSLGFCWFLGRKGQGF